MRTLIGTVVSSSMKKTVVVLVSRLKKHPKYGKYYRVSRRFKAHDENQEYRTGDRIVIRETRPLSREKRWKAIELVRRTAETEEGGLEESRMSNAQTPMTNKAPSPQ